MWAAQYFWGDNPYSFITSGGLGTMGFEVPAAIGVQFARPQRHRLGVLRRRRLPDDDAGAGALHEYELPIKFAIINNDYLGMVRQWQDTFYDGNKQSRAHVPAGLREAGRGDRHHRHPRHAKGDGRVVDRGGAAAPGRRAARLPGRGGGGLLSDDAAGRQPVGHDRPAEDRDAAARAPAGERAR